MDFLKLSPVFTKCSVLYPNIPVGEDHRVCISRLQTIVDRQSAFNFLISVPDNFCAKSCTTTFDTHVVPTMEYPYCIVFNRDTLFMSLHLQSWAANKEIKLEPSTAYHPQTDGQSEIVNKKIIQVARACKAEGNEQLSKIPEIQLKLNSRYNASHRNNPFVVLLGFDTKLGLDTFPYPINKYQTVTERHNTTSQALTNAKTSQAKQANLYRTGEPQYKVRDKVLLSTKNSNIQNVSPKMKPLWIGLFTILSANYNCNNYSLDLSSDPSLNLICNTFHVSKIKPYVNNSQGQASICQRSVGT